MKLKKKVCKGKGKLSHIEGCGQVKYIYGHGCCEKCYRRATFKPLLSKPPTSRITSRKKKATPYEEKNYKQLFLRIWEARVADDGKHYSEIDKTELLPITHKQWHWQFSHILHSGLYMNFGFPMRDDNVVLCTVAQHTYYGEKGDAWKSDPSWAWVVGKYDNLRKEYHEKKKDIVAQLKETNAFLK